MNEEELTPEIYAKKKRNRTLRAMVCDSFILAESHGIPSVWVRRVPARPFSRGAGITHKWLIVGDHAARCYMFKDCGLFGWGEKEDRWKNMFDTPEEAARAYREFYPVETDEKPR